MISQPLRRVAGLLCVGVIGLGLTGCSNTTSDAATITYRDGSGEHSIHITNSDFKEQLGALVGNAQFQELLEGNGFDLTGDQENTTSSNISAIYLSQLVEQSAIDAEFESLGLEVSDAQRSLAADQAKNTWGGADVFASFPQALQDVLIDQQARASAVGAYFKVVTEAKKRALYDEFKDTICPSGRQVLHILVKDLAAAKAIGAQLKSGASFAELARTKSTDTNSAKAGGSLGCLRRDAYVKEFETAAYAAAFDEPTAPVKSEFGYHVILIMHPTYATVSEQITQALQQSPLVIVKNLRMQEMKVWINPQYGSGALAADSQSGQLVYQVTPPSVPEPRTVREKAPTTTSPTIPLAGG